MTSPDLTKATAELRHWFFQKLNPQQRTNFLVAAGVAPQTCDLTLGMQHQAIERIAAALSTLPQSIEPSEAMIEAGARSALFKIELARVHHIQPVNGAFDYFQVEFAGHRTSFKLPYPDEDCDYIRGPLGPDLAELSGKAGAWATAINDLLFNLAKEAARAMCSAQGECDSGASPSGRATRASTEPQEGLGHSAGIPDAEESA